MRTPIAAVAAAILAAPAFAQPAETPWVLLGLDIRMGVIHMGVATMRDTAADADTVSVYGEGLPVYRTRAACQAALRHAIRKYAEKSHADGNFGRYACLDWRSWATLR